MKREYIVCLLVKDEPGVMNRITGLIARRNFNIDTIAVGKTEKAGISKIILTISATQRILEQLKKQLGKLVDVVKVIEIPQENAIVRELCLVKVAVKNQNARKEITSYAKMFRANIVDVTPKSLIIQLAGKPKKIEAFLDLIKKFGIKEISRSGKDAMIRGS